MKIEATDLLVFIIYCISIIALGLYVSRSKKGREKSSKDYFLAGKSLAWWAIGASIIASNISAEQFIGMSGSGYAIGLGIASYEWMGGLTLIVVAKYFMPIYLKKGIYTMPQFLEQRFDARVRTSLAIFWLALYIFVNLTSVLYLGALFLKTVLGIQLFYGMVSLAAFSLIYSIYGGLMAVAWTDIVQVVFLVGGGLITTFVALDTLGNGQGIYEGFMSVLTMAPEKFDMILSPSHAFYDKLPGISVLIGGMWVLNLAYFGCNQYIIQRALAAKNLREAQKGMIFAGYLKILLPVIVVLPGIIAFTLNADIQKPDEAYPWLLNTFVPTGIRGAAIAALIAAIVSSLASMTNSTAAIFTMDIYKNYINKKATEKQLVNVGRTMALFSMALATIIAKPLLADLDQAFQFIQEYTGFVSPAIFAIFGFGLFWKRTTSNAVLSAALAAIPLSVLFKAFWPSLPFMDRVSLVFLILCSIIWFISIRAPQPTDQGIALEKSMFYTRWKFNIGALGITLLLAGLYILFW